MTNHYLIFSTEHYTVEQSHELPIPGYLILKPTQTVDSLSTITTTALHQLGPMMALSYACIEQLINPEIIYCARFGEKVRAIHFHLFPRSTSIGTAYRKAHNLNEHADISGPQLLDWMMNHNIQLNLGDPLDVLPLFKNKFRQLEHRYLSSTNPSL